MFFRHLLFVLHVYTVQALCLLLIRCYKTFALSAHQNRACRPYLNLMWSNPDWTAAVGRASPTCERATTWKARAASVECNKKIWEQASMSSFSHGFFIKNYLYFQTFPETGCPDLCGVSLVYGGYLNVLHHSFELCKAMCHLISD